VLLLHVNRKDWRANLYACAGPTGASGSSGASTGRESTKKTRQRRKLPPRAGAGSSRSTQYWAGKWF